MSSVRNRFGLTRHIPEEIKAEIRWRSQFGCVHCRNAIYTYEHIDPEFKNANEHDPQKICLLCGSCHGRVTSGQIAKATIKAEYAQLQETEAAAAWSDFDLSGGAPLKVSIGKSQFIAPKTIFRIGNRDILAFEAPEKTGTPPRLSGEFYDERGRSLLKIIKNEWTFAQLPSDVKIEGRLLTIKTHADAPALVVELRPPNELHIRSILMFVDNVVIRTIDDLVGVFLVQDGELGPGLAVEFDCFGADACIVADPARCGIPYRGLSITGRKGIKLDGPDIYIGAGNGRAYIRRIQVY